MFVARRVLHGCVGRCGVGWIDRPCYNRTNTKIGSTVVFKTTVLPILHHPRGGIRTHDLWLRRPTLYPAGLRTVMIRTLPYYTTKKRLCQVIFARGDNAIDFRRQMWYNIEYYKKIQPACLAARGQSACKGANGKHYISKYRTCA